MPIVTAYEALGTNGLTSSLLETGAKAIFVDVHLLSTLLIVLESSRSLELQWIVLNDGGQVDSDSAAQEDLHNFTKAHSWFRVISFEELRRLGEDNPIESVPPDREDLCAIFYTSGSTGIPKGVPIKHKAVVASGKFFAPRIMLALLMLISDL